MAAGRLQMRTSRRWCCFKQLLQRSHVHAQQWHSSSHWPSPVDKSLRRCLRASKCAGLPTRRSCCRAATACCTCAAEFCAGAASAAAVAPDASTGSGSRRSRLLRSRASRLSFVRVVTCDAFESVAVGTQQHATRRLDAWAGYNGSPDSVACLCQQSEARSACTLACDPSDSSRRLCSYRRLV